MDPPSDWSMRGGLEEEEKDVEEEDGKHFFCQKRYISSAARFENVPYTAIPPDMEDIPCPKFCPACVRRAEEEAVSEAGRKRVMVAHV